MSRILVIAGLVGVIVGLGVASFDWLTADLLLEHVLELPVGVAAATPAVGLLAALALRRWLTKGASAATADEYSKSYHDAGKHLDLHLVTSTAKGIQQEMAQAQARITTWEAAHPGAASIGEDEIAAALDHAGGLAALISGAEREPRARLYRALGLDLLLDPVGDSPTIRARLQLCGGGGRI